MMEVRPSPLNRSAYTMGLSSVQVNGACWGSVLAIHVPYSLVTTSLLVDLLGN